MPPPLIRDFQSGDAMPVNALAVRAFEQYRDAYQDWPEFRAKIGNMAALAATGELIVAEIEGRIVGAVAYVGPGVQKAEFFRPEWAIMRMLVVDPEARGLGIGRTLAQECLQRARRDKVSVFALHTSKLMQVALPMYQRMGFKLLTSTPPIHGVEYGVYTKDLNI